MPDIWLTWSPEDDRDFRLRVIATWLFLALVAYILVLCGLRIWYLKMGSAANSLFKIALGSAVIAYSVYRGLRNWMKVGISLLISAVLTACFNVWMALQFL